MGGGKKYYSGFIFDHGMIDDLHCTHCYFGSMGRSRLMEVKTEIDRYFAYFGPIEMPVVKFDRVGMFGPNNDTRVLITDDLSAFRAVDNLRKFFTLSGAIGGAVKYPFTPHVRTDLFKIDTPFVQYVLVESGKILYRWNVWTNRG